jgi:hypothetical protein
VKFLYQIDAAFLHLNSVLTVLGTSRLRRSLRCCGTLESRASIKTRSFLMSLSTHLAMHPALSVMRIKSPMETYDETMLSPSCMMMTSPSPFNMMVVSPTYVPAPPPVTSGETPLSFMSCDSDAFVQTSNPVPSWKFSEHVVTYIVSLVCYPNIPSVGFSR